MDPHIDALQRVLDRDGPAALEELWARLVADGTPLIEPQPDGESRVTFLWRGEAETTSIEWGVRLDLRRISGTDLWHGSIVVPSDLRTLYYLAHDGAQDVPGDTGAGPTHIDATNRRPFHFPRDPRDPSDRDNWASLLELPAARPEPWLADPGAARGTTLEEIRPSAALGGPRPISVHLPAGVATDGLGALVVFDGNLSRAVLRVPTTVDNLTAADRIPPLVTIFVHTPDDRRDDELGPQPSIVDHVVDEVLPWAADRWGVGADPSANVIAGASRGGLAAAYVALCRPDRFGAVLSQSGSFWWPRRSDGEPEWLTRQYAARPRLPLRFYLDVGDREDGPGPDGGPSQVDVNRRLRDVLRERGYPLTYVEYRGAHDYVNWRRTFADALLALAPHQ